MEKVRLIEIKEEILSDNKGLADQLRSNLLKNKTFFIPVSRAVNSVANFSIKGFLFSVLLQLIQRE